MDDLKIIINENSEKDEHLKCGECRKHLSVPPIIYLESSMSYLCGRCQQKSFERDSIEVQHSQRQFLYENIAKYLTFPCSYKILGCRAELEWGHVVEHETICPFRNTMCPLSVIHKDFLCIEQTCCWRGSDRQLVSHLKLSHKENFISPPQLILRSDFRTTFIFTEVLKQVMIIVFKYYEDLDKFNVLVLGNLSDIECSYFRYQVEICGNFETSIVFRRNKIEPMCDSVFKSMTNRSGLEIDVRTLREMLKNTNSLLVKVGIVKKNRKEIKALRSNVPLGTILNTPLKEKMQVLDEGILQELECPVCNDYMIPPIFICQAGHSVCDSCNNKISSCPTCRSTMLNTRNFSLEKLTSRVNYPCRNRSFGCFFVASSEKIRNHEKNCTLTGKNCVLKCPWKGNTIDMIIHLTEKHHVLQLDQINTIFLGPHKKTISDAIVYDNQIFVFTVWYGFKMAFQYSLEYLGSDYLKYKYELHIIDRTGNGLNLVLRHLCSPFKDNLDRRKDRKGDSTNGYTLPYDLIQHLIFETKELEYKVNISKLKERK